jgi:hypothetical protein
MSDSSTILRRLGIWLGTRLAVFCLSLVLLLVSLSIVLHATVMDPGFAKSAFRSSGLYDSFVENTITLLAYDKEGAAQEQDRALAQTLRGLTPVYEQVLTPALLQTNTEEVIDSLDAWLKGKTDKPQFDIDTAAIRGDLNVALADYISARLPTLPVCPVDTDTTGYDPLTATCRLDVPPTEDTLVRRADGLSSEFPILAEDRLTADDMFLSSDSRAWRDIPRAYWWNTFLTWLFVGLLPIITGVVLYLDQDRVKVLRKIGRMVRSNGLLLLLGGGLVFVASATSLFTPGSYDVAGMDAFARDTLLPLLHSAARGVGIWLLCLGAGFVLLSIACSYAARVLQRRQVADTGTGGSGDFGPNRIA